MFLIRLNHLIAVLAIFEKAPAHSPKHSQMAWLLVVLLVSWLSGVGGAPDLPSLEDDTTCTTPENHML